MKTMKTTKAMKATKSMKSMKKKSMKKMKAKKEKTLSGLKKDDLKKNADGKIVSKKRSELAKKAYHKSGNGLKKWFKAVSAARKALGIKGMVPVGGKTDKGQALLKKVRSLYK